ncbi:MULTISPECIES: DUF268 domain-containing protein [Acinetobacter]|uniref:DUF268 domain-containing protein n=1 Tax=Acinetobacter TaxID=469 RepID=UPI000EA26756|nr:MULTISPECIES: DUF268 domain-containing protein [Acinetobacter]RKG46099.1 DUF268 domain-containing protein [Acinetobacter cumulans]RZG61261.1 DUF268 domain-containing protein [Acinetobacter sp. WCHAc060006]
MLHRVFFIFGGNWLKFKSALFGWGWFFKDFLKILKQNNKLEKKWRFKIFPVLHDKAEECGVAKGQYFYQDIYVAKKIYEKNPTNHLDIASRIDGFVAHVSIFRKIDVMDIRPLRTQISSINFIQSDLMKPQSSMQYDSISCLHAIEHFGLGRYGDALDIDGHLKALENIKKKLVFGGFLYFSTQIGEQRIEFNAGRFFNLRYLIDLLLVDFELVEFSYIDDNGDFWENVNLLENKIDSNYECTSGCGIFILRKK